MDEVYATEIFVSNVEAHDGSTCSQPYCGNKSSFTHVFGIKTKSDMPGTLMDFIRTFGAMKGLFSDNYKFQTGAAIKDILRQYNIDDIQSEPLQKNQNPPKRRIQEFKANTNMVMYQTGAPPSTWLLCMVYIE